jgi:hypothetical protein
MPEETASGSEWTGEWVCSGTGLDDVKKEKILLLPGLKNQPLGWPSVRQPTHPSIHPSVRLSIYGSAVLCWMLAAFSVLNPT